MPSIRHLYFAAISVVALVAAIAAGIAGIKLCSAPVLPGDELWAWREALERASSYALGGPAPGCYLPGWGSRLLAFCGLGRWLMLLGPAVWLAWEFVFRPLRRARLRREGRHALIFGDLDNSGALALDQRQKRSIALVAPDAKQAWRIANRFPFTETLVAGDSTSLLKQVDRLGGPAASLVAAVSDRDLENMAIAEHLLLGASRRSPNMALRVEQTVVRTMRSQPLQEAADRKGSKLTVFSLSMLQLRAGLHEAMPGRFTIAGSKGYHAAICGSGPMVAQLSFMLARQGYWAEQALPRISIMRTGFRDFAPGQIERLTGATLAANVVADHVDPEDVASFERATSSIATAEPHLHAIHCVGETPAEALALAQRWERVLLALRLPVPPIVAYGPKAVKSASGMIRTIPEFDPSEAAQAMRLADSRARAVHQDYLAGQRQEKKEKFGLAPAEVEWEQLAERFRDDNRNTADHIEYKLARVGLRAIASPDVSPFKLSEADVQLLGRIEHGRWMAARNIAGFRYGAKRDDGERLHPDLVAFDELTRAAQDKDFDVVRAIPKMLALGQQQVERLRPSRSKKGQPEGIAEFEVNDEEAIAAAETKLAAAAEVVAVIGPAGRNLLAAGDALAQRLAAVLNQSYEIRHLTGEGQPEGTKLKETADA